jgi:hypothetical protein
MPVAAAAAAAAALLPGRQLARATYHPPCLRSPQYRPKSVPGIVNAGDSAADDPMTDSNTETTKSNAKRKQFIRKK